MTACNTARETTKGSDPTTVVSGNSEAETETIEQKEDTIIPLFERMLIHLSMVSKLIQYKTK